jgi:hypothetical protein
MARNVHRKSDISNKGEDISARCHGLRCLTSLQVLVFGSESSDFESSFSVFRYPASGIGWGSKKKHVGSQNQH